VNSSPPAPFDDFRGIHHGHVVAISATMPRSWVIIRIDIPTSACSARSSRVSGLDRHIEAVVGSSAINRRGEQASAMAIMAVAACPEN